MVNLAWHCPFEGVADEFSNRGIEGNLAEGKRKILVMSIADTQVKEVFLCPVAWILPGYPLDVHSFFSCMWW